MPPLKRYSMCPNCMHSYRDFKVVSSVEIARCNSCGQVMCANCCKSPVWSGYICPKCGSRELEPIGRIKDPSDMPTFQEDLRDGTVFKSSLSPRTLRVLAVVSVSSCWLIGFPFWVNVVFTISGLIVFASAEKITRQ